MNRLDTLSPPTVDVQSTTPASIERRYGNSVSGGTLAGGSRRLNVGQGERAVSVAGGAALVGFGLLRGRLSGLAMAGLGVMVIKRGIEGHCSVYESLGVNTATADGPADPTALYERGVKIYHAITINRPAQELYDYWHDYTNQPRFMPNVESVRVEGNRGIGQRSFWRLKGPAGVIVEYEAETINDEPGRLIAWRSVAGADVQHAGSVRFLEAPGDRGTEVHFNVEYLPPAGVIGKFGAKLLRLIGQAPKNDVRQGLRQFKQLMEAGELPSNEGPRGEKC